MTQADLWIVKLGGSLMEAPELRVWLAAIARPGPAARLVVPGGGPFADTVRRVQYRLGLDDLAAHRMAILAMQQYALLLRSLEPGLALVESEEEVKNLRESRACGVWLPWRMIGRDRTVEASWEVTSDSLALLLARRLDARRLIVVKSARAPAGASLDELAATGLVDAAFTRLADGLEERIELVSRDVDPAGVLARDRRAGDDAGAPRG